MQYYNCLSEPLPPHTLISCAPYLLEIKPNIAYPYLLTIDTTKIQARFVGLYRDTATNQFHPVVTNTFDYSLGFQNFKDTFVETFSYAFLGFLAVCFLVAITIFFRKFISQVFK